MTTRQLSDAGGAPLSQAAWQPLPAEPLLESPLSPTYWPATLAFGITLLCWGLVTTWIISVVGLIVFAVGLAGWIGELCHAE